MSDQSFSLKKVNFIETSHMTQLQLTPQAIQRQQQEIDRCCSLYYVIIGSIYNIAQSAMIDAYTYIRRDPRYRHQTKQDINYAIQAYEKWDHRMRHTLGDRYQLWLDISDAIAEYIQHDVQVLLYAFDDHLMHHNIPDHLFIATVENSLTIVQMAQQTFETMFDDFQRKCHIDLRPLFNTGNFQDIQFRWRRAVRTFLKTPDNHPDINFNDSPRVTLAYDILIRKLSDPDTYNIASRSALQLNQDICRKYDKQFDQKMQELQQQYQDK